MRAALVALVLMLAAPAASQPRLAEFDLEALEAARVEIGATGRARIELPQSVSFGYQVILDATGPTSAGYYLTGTLEGLPDWPVKVVVHGELAAATVYWTVWRSGGGGSAADAPPSRSPTAFEPWGNDVVMAPRLSRPLRLTAVDAADAAAPMEDGSWIDVLVFYTPEAKQEDAGGDAAIMELLVDLMIVHTNAVYAESGVAHRLRLAAQPVEAEPFREAGFRTSGEMLQMLSEWERGRELRDRYEADLLTLLFSGKGLESAFSLAYLNSPDRVTADEALPFSVTCSTCSRAFPHEIGHNFGLLHDRYEWADNPLINVPLIDVPHPEAFGFAGPIDGDPDTDCIVTVMAAGLECVEDGFRQVVRFSNPERETRGIATGIPGTEPSAETDGPANAARHMNGMRRYAANWRQAPCLSGGSSVRLQASNGQYVRAAGNGGGAVRADQRRRWPDGLFTLVDHNGGACVESGDSVSLQTSEGFYLHAQLGGGAGVDATARQASPETRFVVRRQLGPGALRAGDTLSLHTGSGHYVVAAQGGGGEVRADSEDRSRLWSRFKVAALWRDPPPRPNRPPVTVGTLPHQELPPGARLDVDAAVGFRDPDGDPLTYAAVSSAPGVVTVSAAGGGVTLTAVGEGTATIRVTATDPGGLSATQTFAATVSLPANRPPEPVGMLAPVTIGADETPVSVEVSGAFRDPEGDVLTYAAMSSSPGVATVLVSGSTVTVTPVAPGTATVTVTATDTGGSNTSAVQAFTVTVGSASNRPPVAVGTLAPVTIGADETPVSVEVSGAFRDPEGDVLTYAAMSSSPGVATVLVSGSTVTVTPVAPGTATVTVTATDTGGSNTSAVQAFTVTVGSASNRPPVAVGTLAPVTIGADETPVSVEVSGAFRDPEGDVLTYAAMSSSPGVATVLVSGSTVTVTPMAPGTATVTVTATDTGGSNTSATQTFPVTVPAPFTDRVLVPGDTPLRAVHFTELRARIDAVRSAAGLARFAWTDPVLTAGVTPVRLTHLLELRSALATAYASSGRSAPIWTDPAPTPGTTPIRAAHLMELRAAVVALE